MFEIVVQVRCYIDEMRLCNFRSYSDASISFKGSSALLIGENGSGKTTILEAISLLAKANGMRNVSMRDMQMKNSHDFWSIHYKFFNGSYIGDIKIERDLLSRNVYVNGKREKAYNMLNGLSSILWFTPEMDYLFLESPSKRMRFFDRIFSIFEKHYVLELIRYNKAKSERSRVLKYDSYKNDSWLCGIEDIMVLSGLKLSQFRQDIITRLEPFFRSIDFKGCDNIVLSFKSDVFNLLEKNNAVDDYRSILKNNREKDSITGKVLFGSHHDGIKIYDWNLKTDVSLFSTGEQKLILLAILIASLLCCESQGHIPIFLLDDIFSHFDNDIKNFLIRLLSFLKSQVLITDVNIFNLGVYVESLNIIKIKEDLES